MSECMCVCAYVCMCVCVCGEQSALDLRPTGGVGRQRIEFCIGICIELCLGSSVCKAHPFCWNLNKFGHSFCVSVCACVCLCVCTTRKRTSIAHTRTQFARSCTCAKCCIFVCVPQTCQHHSYIHYTHTHSKRIQMANRTGRESVCVCACARCTCAQSTWINLTL